MRIAITGTPGTGKSDTARLLGQKLGWHVIHLSKFVKEKRLYTEWDRARKCWIVDEKGLIREIGKIRENLIIEGHFAHILPSDLVIVLRSDPKVIRKRLKKRGWSKAKIEENVEAEIMEICKTEAAQMNKNVIEIDTTSKSKTRIVSEMIRVIEQQFKSINEYKIC